MRKILPDGTGFLNKIGLKFSAVDASNVSSIYCCKSPFPQNIFFLCLTIFSIFKELYHRLHDNRILYSQS